MNKREYRKYLKYKGVNLPKQIRAYMTRSKLEKYEELRIAARFNPFQYLPTLGFLILFFSVMFNYQFAEALGFQGIAGKFIAIVFVLMDCVRYFVAEQLGQQIVNKSRLSRLYIFIMVIFGIVAIYAFATINSNNARKNDNANQTFERELESYNSRVSTLKETIKEARESKPDQEKMDSDNAGLEKSIASMDKLLNGRYKRKLIGPQLEGCKVENGKRVCGKCFKVNGTYTRRYCGRYNKLKSDIDKYQKRVDRHNRYRSPDKMVAELNNIMANPPKRPDTAASLSPTMVIIIGLLIELLGMMMVLITPTAWKQIRLSRIAKNELRKFVRVSIDAYIETNSSEAEREDTGDSRNKTTLAGNLLSKSSGLKTIFTENGMHPMAFIVAKCLRDEHRANIITSKTLNKVIISTLLANKSIAKVVLNSEDKTAAEKEAAMLKALLEWNVTTKGRQGNAISSKFINSFKEFLKRY